MLFNSVHDLLFFRVALFFATPRRLRWAVLLLGSWTSGESPAGFYLRPEFPDPGLYVDAGHLNADGAGRLSALVAGRLQSEVRPALAAGAP